MPYWSVYCVWCGGYISDALLECVPDPTDPQNILKTSGRGILFMRTFMDEVEWSHHPEGGTMVRMIKKI